MITGKKKLMDAIKFVSIFLFIYLYKMERKLIIEINRITELMKIKSTQKNHISFQIISEQKTFVDNIISLGGLRIKNFDNILEVLGLSKKSVWSETDIDNFCDELSENQVMDEIEINNFRSELKKNYTLRQKLLDTSNDFISYIKKLANENKNSLENLSGLNKIITLSGDDLKRIAKSIYTKLITNVDSNVKKSFDRFDAIFSGQLQKAYDKGFIFHDTDEMWDVIDGYILEDVNTLGLSDEMAEEQFNLFKQKLRESSKTKDIIDKINADGRNLKSGKRTTDVTYSKDYKVPEEWKGGSKWKSVDETEEIPTITTKTKIKIGNTSEETIFNVLSKEGILKEEVIRLIRDLLNENLTNSYKLYLENISSTGLQEYMSTLNLLKEKFGNLKLYVSDLSGVGNTKMTIDEFNNFVQNNYKRIYDDNGNISPLNKLDTNYVDGPNQIIELMKKTLTKDEIDSFADIIKKLSMIPEKDVLQNSLTMIELKIKWSEIVRKLKNNSKESVESWYNDADSITTKIKQATEAGNLAENKINKLLADPENGGAKIIYTASEGSPIDSVLNIDTIIDDVANKFGGGIKTVQIKKAKSVVEGEFQYVNVVNKKQGTSKMQWKFVPKSGTGRYRVVSSERVAKQSQIDISGFADESGNCIISGRQKQWIGYDQNGLPMFSEKEILPGSQSRSAGPIQIFIVDPETPKIVGKL
jgi:hypothetical protein